MLLPSLKPSRRDGCNKGSQHTFCNTINCPKSIALTSCYFEHCWGTVTVLFLFVCLFCLFLFVLVVQST